MKESRATAQANALTRKREREERHSALMAKHDEHRALKKAQAEWDAYQRIRLGGMSFDEAYERWYESQPL